MTDQTPAVDVDAAQAPDNPDTTVVTGRFNRKKIARAAGTAAAVAGVLLVTFGLGKTAGKVELVEDALASSDADDDAQDTVAS